MTASLSFAQRLLRRLTPAATFARIEAESRQWDVVCQTCGWSKDVWSMGGLRGGASGRRHSRGRCPSCHTFTRFEFVHRA